MTPHCSAGLRAHWLRRILLVAVAACLIASSCSSDTEDAESVSTSATPSATDVPSPTATPPPPTPLPTTEPIAEPTPKPTPTAIATPVPTATPEFGPSGRPSSAGEVLVLTATPAVFRPTVYDGPNGSEVSVPYQFLDGRVDDQYDHFKNPTFFGNPLALMVLEGQEGDEWARVQIPTRPIIDGWINTAEFTWSSSNYYVQINIANNTVTVWDGEEIIANTAVVTGDVGRETPLTSTFVDEIMDGPNSAYGPKLLSLGVFSDAINTFGSAGGLPKIAMHGTNKPELLGQYASNGCIRLPNDVIDMLAARVPVGTRVDIVST